MSVEQARHERRVEEIGQQLAEVELPAAGDAYCQLFDETFVNMVTCMVIDGVMHKLAAIQAGLKGATYDTVVSERHVVVTEKQLDRALKSHVALVRNADIAFLSCPPDGTGWEDWLQSELDKKTTAGVIPRVVVSYDDTNGRETYATRVESVGLQLRQK